MHQLGALMPLQLSVENSHSLTNTRSVMLLKLGEAEHVVT